MLSSLAVAVFFLLQGTGPDGGEASPLRLGTRMPGVVSEEDAEVHTPKLDAEYVQAPTRGRRHVLEVESAGTYTIELHSFFFDAYLVLRTEDGSLVVEDDDGYFETQSRLAAHLEPGQTYHVFACALHGQVGDYSIELKQGPPPDLPPAYVTRIKLEYDKERLQLFEARYGSDHPNTAFALLELGGRTHATADYAEAIRLVKRAVAIYEFHPESVEQLIRAFSTLGVLYMETGDLARARMNAERAVEMAEEQWGSATGPIYLNFGEILHSLGDLESAELYLQAALEVFELQQGPGSVSAGIALNGLGAVALERADYGAAIEAFERNAEIWERKLGPNHPGLAIGLNNLAVALRNAGKFEAARIHTDRALEIMAHNGVEDHPAISSILSNDAELAINRGDSETAAEILRRAADYAARFHGLAHESTVLVQNQLAMVLFNLGEGGEAWDIVASAQAEVQKNRERTLLSLTEAERFQYLDTLGNRLQLTLSIESQVPAEESQVVSYESVLGWKGIVGRTLCENRTRLRGERSADMDARISELRACQKELAGLSLETAMQDPRGQAARLNALRAQRHRLERELLDELETDRRLASLGWRELRDALPEGSAALDFLFHSTYLPAEPGSDERGAWQPRGLTAWITRTNTEHPRRVDLGSSDALSGAVQRFLAALEEGADLEGAGGELRGLLWSPLAPHLEGVERVFVSPDGVLGALPFETLPLDGGRFAVEEFSFVYLQEFSTLAEGRPAPSPRWPSMLVLGGVEYSALPPSEAAAVKATAPLQRALGSSWEALPHSLREASALLEQHERARPEGSSRALTAEEATEAALEREMPRHAIVHLATHGYFNPEGLPSLWSELGFEHQQPVSEELAAAASAVEAHHPGLLSGLVLAGANVGSDSADDGYLTAEEIGWLDLSDVELVVLSGCDTGLGRPRSGEGLLGLRRAFLMAGASTVVSSLWSVGDESAALLMEEFYGNLLEKGMGRHEALRAAQLELLDLNHPPSTWGAFVLNGEWR